MEDPDFIKYACNLASYSVANGGGPFGCVIVDKSNIVVAEGHNRVALDNDPTSHAEIVAIRNLCAKTNTFDLSNYTLYSSCEPCPMCLSAIYWSRIQNVYYGNTRFDAAAIGFSDADIYNEFVLSPEHKVVKLHQCATDNMQNAFIEWSNMENKTKY